MCAGQLSIAPVIIYQSMNRTKLYRGFGALMIFNSTLLSGISYYFFKFPDDPYHALKEEFRCNLLLPVLCRLVERSDQSNLPAWLENRYESAKVPCAKTKNTLNFPTLYGSKTTAHVESDSEAVTDRREGLDWIQEKVKDSSLIKYSSGICATLSGAIIFTLGAFMPLRIVSRLTLLPTSDHGIASAAKVICTGAVKAGPRPVTSSTQVPPSQFQVVEIETHGILGFGRSRVCVPLHEIRKVSVRSEDSPHLHFYAKGRPCAFYLEKTGARFPKPDMYDYVFAVQRIF